MASTILCRTAAVMLIGLSSEAIHGLLHVYSPRHCHAMVEIYRKNGIFECLPITASNQLLPPTQLRNARFQTTQPRLAVIPQPFSFYSLKPSSGICRNLLRCFMSTASTYDDADVPGERSETVPRRRTEPIANVPTLFPTKRKTFKKPNGTIEVVYQTQLGPLRQSSLLGSERYNESVAEPDDAVPQAAALHRYRARVLYDGSNYHGWQLQPRQPSVQGLLEAVLSFKLRHPVRVVGAGRTDTGVHARGQAVHFDAPAPIADLARFQHGVNMVLPADVRVACMEPTEGLVYVDLVGCYKRWHAIYSATGKLYSYRLYVGPTPDPLQRLTRFADRLRHARTPGYTRTHAHARTRTRAHAHARAHTHIHTRACVRACGRAVGRAGARARVCASTTTATMNEWDSACVRACVRACARARVCVCACVRAGTTSTVTVT